MVAFLPNQKQGLLQNFLLTGFNCGHALNLWAQFIEQSLKKRVFAPIFDKIAIKETLNPLMVCYFGVRLPSK
jgi:hypothetical protein